MSDVIIEDNLGSKFNVTPRELFFRYIRYVPWLALSVAIMFFLAFLKLRYSTDIYKVTGSLLVSNPNPYGNGNDKFDDIFMMQGNVKLNDEIEIIKSRAMAARVVKALGLENSFTNIGKIRNSKVHPRDLPFDFQLIGSPDSVPPFTLNIKLQDGNQFNVNNNNRKYAYGELVTLGMVNFMLLPTGIDPRAFASNEFVISRQSRENVAAGLSRAISVNQLNDFSNVLGISMETQNVHLGFDIVNQYMREYQQASLEDKREIASKTLAFISDQLDTVRKDLVSVERNLQLFQEKNKVYSPQDQSQLLFSELSETDKLISTENVKLKITEYLINYLVDSKNRYKIVPSMLGIEEPALLQQVTEFNKLQLERETTLKSVPAGNSIILNMETAIEKLRGDMIENLRHVKETYLLALRDLNQKNQAASRTISTIPNREKQLREVTRQQNILQELYSYLLQKNLETSIASASTISNIKVVESAMTTGVPVSPNRKALYMIALFLGIAIPAGIVFLREYLDDKVKSRKEIETATAVPILGEIGHAEDSNTLVVVKNSRNFLAEQFRIIRTNINYILPRKEKPVLLVTSSFSGEGKSFISTNLGAVMALSGKSTVILEFDIRKPKIMRGLGLKQRKGLTNFIVGDIDLDSIVYPVPDMENLFVIPCGPVPPNPAEMLLQEKVEELFRQLKERFDAIIIDTAPVGLVSDGISLGTHADAAVYIVRHNYTNKKQISLIDDLYKYGKLPHLSIIINDITAHNSYGGYYGYGGYGYSRYGYGGYGYGMDKSSSEYFDFSRKKKKKKLAVKRWLGF